jgi:hypothetical protein
MGQPQTKGKTVQNEQICIKKTMLHKARMDLDYS